MTVGPDGPGRGNDVNEAVGELNARAWCATTPEPLFLHTLPSASPNCSSCPDY
jgi:hypothetical protein